METSAFTALNKTLIGIGELVSWFFLGDRINSEQFSNSVGYMPIYINKKKKTIF